MTESKATGEALVHRVSVHTKTLADLLSSHPKKETPQRIFRTRFWESGNYTVVTLVQNVNYTPPPNQPDIKIQLFVTRPYTANQQGVSVAAMSLLGQYSVDEIVAFLGLDKIDPETLEWVDETKYSPLVVVGDILGRLH